MIRQIKDYIKGIPTFGKVTIGLVGIGIMIAVYNQYDFARDLKELRTINREAELEWVLYLTPLERIEKKGYIIQEAVKRGLVEIIEKEN